TKGMAQKWPTQGVATGHEFFKEDQIKELQEKYTPEIVNKVGEMAKKIGGHGGIDSMMDWRLIDCLRNGLPLDQDVYDAALWSAIAALSERSVDNRSKSADVPEFPGGGWKENRMVELTLKGGRTAEESV